MHGVKSILSICLIVCLGYATEAQVYFDNTYETPLGFGNSGNALVWDGTHFITCGNSNFYNGNCFQSSIDIFRVNLSGLVDTLQTPGSISTDWRTSRFIATMDSNYIVYSNHTSCFTPSTVSSTLLKLNESGSTLWTAPGGNQSIIYLKQLDDQSLLGAGQYGFNDGINLTVSQMALSKWDSSGNIIWSKTYGDNSLFGYAVSVQVFSDNSYMMIGNVRDSITNYGDALIVKTDSAGNQIWTKRIPSDQDIVIDGGLITNDSNCLIYGHEYDSITNDRQAFFSKLDTSGNTLWKKTYGDLNHESVYHTIELSDGTMIAIGAEWTGPNQSTGFMMKLSEAGDSLWWRTFGDTDTSINRFNSVTENGNGGFICTGESKGDMWLVNTDSLGCLISNCATGITNTERQREEVSIYPVPFREKLKIEIEADTPNELMVSIVNVLGQVVQSYPNLQMMPGKNVITLNTLDQHFSNGIYFISVTVDGLSYHFPAMRY